jgi:Zn-dependent M32 family carboxypeptidase
MKKRFLSFLLVFNFATHAAETSVTHEQAVTTPVKNISKRGKGRGVSDKTICFALGVGVGAIAVALSSGALYWYATYEEEVKAHEKNKIKNEQQKLNPNKDYSSSPPRKKKNNNQNKVTYSVEEEMRRSTEERLAKKFKPQIESIITQTQQFENQNPDANSIIAKYSEMLDTFQDEYCQDTIDKLFQDIICRKSIEKKTITYAIPSNHAARIDKALGAYEMLTS